MRGRFVLVLAIILGLSAFWFSRFSASQELSSLISTPSPPSLPVTSDAWETIQPGVARFAHVAVPGKTLAILLYQFDPVIFRFRFLYREDALTVGEWYASRTGDRAMMNGVYFDEEHHPLGLFVSEGKYLGKQRIDPKRSAFFELSPTPRIIDTTERPIPSSGYNEAGQSYPLLIKNGKGLLKEDSGQYARRSFFGLDREGKVYFGIVPDQAVSLYEFMNALLALPVSWSEVINLDGGTSSGLAVKMGEHEEVVNSFVPVPVVIIAEPKNSDEGR